jgi:flagellin
MSLVVNTNIASMNAQRSLSTSGRELQTAMERLSTGKKINSAADDAAGFSIAESMTAQIRGLSMASKNASDGISLLKVVENATNDVTDMLQRVRELAVQAKSGTNSATDIKNLQGEADALMNEITRVSTDTTYNGKARLGADAGTVNIQVGYEDGDQIALTSYSVSSASLSLETDALLVLNKASARTNADNITAATASGVAVGAAAGAAAKETSLAGFFTTASDAESGDAAAKLAAGNAARALQANIDTATGLGNDANTDAVRAAGKEAALVVFENAATKKLDISSATALTTISAAVDKVSGYKAEWGAGQNRLEYTVSNLMNVVEFTSAARSRIQDADFAAEAAKLAKAQVLQQTGAAMLAQANAAPQLALQLIK